MPKPARSLERVSDALDDLFFRAWVKRAILKQESKTRCYLNLGQQYEDLAHRSATPTRRPSPEFLRQKYRNAPIAQPAKASEIDKEPFIGMWSDREDLIDSSQAVRELRKSEWGDNS